MGCEIFDDELRRICSESSRDKFLQIVDNVGDRVSTSLDIDEKISPSSSYIRYSKPGEFCLREFAQRGSFRGRRPNAPMSSFWTTSLVREKGKRGTKLWFSLSARTYLSLGCNGPQNTPVCVSISRKSRISVS